MAKSLTPRQAEVLAFVMAYVERYGFPPTLKEIAMHYGCVHPQSAHRHLIALECKAYIRTETGNNRAITVLRDASGQAVHLAFAAGQADRAELPPARWSARYDRCVRCLSEDAPHEAGGLCILCYNRRGYQRNRPARLVQAKRRRLGLDDPQRSVA